jgi:RHH-type proline utilization regulon transcriptional repressor/proline dehydrogenase/delta 1-pyrroline-5-carboxylate dehydrogenase
LDETISFVSERVRAGNIYINRNIVGAVVGAQPFGGQNLSGTGPKAGGPLYLERLLSRNSESGIAPAADPTESVAQYYNFLKAQNLQSAAARVARYMQTSAHGRTLELPGPVGERNTYTLKARGVIAAHAQTQFGLLVQVGAILASGNRVCALKAHPAADVLKQLPKDLQSLVISVANWQEAPELGGLLFEGDADELLLINQAAAERAGPIVIVQGTSVSGLASAAEDYSLNLLMHEVSTSINTAAAGGNASLMSIG